MPVECNGNTIRLVGPLNANEFAIRLGQLVQAGCTSIDIESDDPGSLYPNIDVPMATTIDYYRSNGVDIRLTKVPRNPMLLSVLNPVEDAALSRVCKFDHQSTHYVVDEIMDYLQGAAEFATGSIDAFSWCLFEIMDNVGNHSEALGGFVEVQVHPKTKRLAICIADSGRGIKNSLSERRRTATDEDAITIAMEHNMTRKPGMYQGNGLWGLTRFVQAGRGSLSILSGIGQVTISVDETGRLVTQKNSGRAWIAMDVPGTIVDFQIPYNRPIDFAEVTGQKPAIEFSEKILDEKQRYVLRVSSQARGYATRKSGAEMYNKTVNYLNAIPVHIVLDFSSISIISSSFADEFIAKLVRNMGFVQFNEMVRIVNTEPNVRSIINQAVVRRLAEWRRPAPAG